MPDTTLHKVCLPHHHFLQAIMVVGHHHPREGRDLEVEAKVEKELIVRIWLKIKVMTIDKINMEIVNMSVNRIGDVEMLTFIVAA